MVNSSMMKQNIPNCPQRFFFKSYEYLIHNEHLHITKVDKNAVVFLKETDYQGKMNNLFDDLDTDIFFRGRGEFIKFLRLVLLYKLSRQG